VDLRAGLDDLEKRKFLTPPGLELRLLSRPSVASRYSDYAIPAPNESLWVNLILALNRSHLNREYTLINVLKALASIISICSLHVTFLSKITPKYFALFTNGMFLPFNVRRDSGGRRL
jgi:hypothetical protein